MSTLYNFTVVLESDTCGKCGGVYALNKAFTDEARRNKGSYHCPYCQTSWGWHESDADRLRKQLEVKERELREEKCRVLDAQRRRDEAEATAAKEQRRAARAKKKLQRVANGVCPCCKRSFNNLRLHMLAKHPEEVPA